MGNDFQSLTCLDVANTHGATSTVSWRPDQCIGDWQYTHISVSDKLFYCYREPNFFQALVSKMLPQKNRENLMALDKALISFYEQVNI